MDLSGPSTSVLENLSPMERDAGCLKGPLALFPALHPLLFFSPCPPGWNVGFRAAVGISLTEEETEALASQRSSEPGATVPGV